jgi:RluA family pseudouridine synthase
VSEPTTRFVVGRREAGRRLDRFLNARIPGLSRARIQRAIRERVRLSWGVTARPATPVRGGGEVWVGWTPLAEVRLELELPLLARGAGWLAVDKPAGIPVHPVNGVRENSLIRILRRQEGREGLRLVHRLDRETSGVLLVAEHAPAASHLSRSFREGRVRKEYLALVAGRLREPEGTIDLPIGKAAGSAVFVKLGVTETGKPARTRYRVEACEGDRTLLRLFPGSGRRHQLRVHLAAIGHPILGDILYGRPERDYLDLVRGLRDARRENGEPARQLLHCASLSFPDPAGGPREIEVRAPLADGFAPFHDGTR